MRNVPSPCRHDAIMDDDLRGRFDFPVLTIWPSWTAANELTSEAFSEYIRENGIDEFCIAGADAAACVKSTCFNMRKADYTVHVISDCVTSYDLKKMDEMLAYYVNKGCEVATLQECLERV